MAEQTPPNLNAAESQEVLALIAEAPMEEESIEEEANSYEENLSDSDDEELPPENPCQDIRGELETVLKQEIKFSGSFSFNKTFDTAYNPGIHVAGLGVVGLPLSVRDAKLVAAHSIQAPFGKGERTIVDTAVRDTWEIDASKVTLENPSWHHFMSTVVAEVCQALGVNAAASKPKCELYKLLLYETGSHFLPHMDTEKANGMFATVIVVLPSEFTGGAAHLSHCGVSKVYDASSTSRFQTTVLAWYTDVTHEIKPVKSGYRLALSYNLIHTNTALLRPALPKSDKDISRLRHILASWKHSLDPSPQKILYLLDHTYSQSGLGGSALKGGDAQRVALLETLADELGFQLGLASLECHLVGTADGACGYGNRRNAWGRYNDSDEEEDEDEDVEFGDIDEREMKITNLVSLDGDLLRDELESDDGEMELECIPSNLQDLVEEGPADDQEYEGYMGNYAGSLERWYRRTVLVIWPNFHDAEVGGGYQENPLDLIQFTQSTKPTRSERRITQQILSRAESDTTGDSHGDVAAIICAAACRWRDIDLWSEAIDVCGLQAVLDSGDGDTFAEAVTAFGFSGLKPILEEIVATQAINSIRFQIIETLRVKFGGDVRPDSEVSAWLQNQKDAVISDLKPPSRGEQVLLLNLAKDHGGLSFIEKVLLPQLLEKSDSDFLVAFASALQMCKKDSSIVIDDSQVANFNRLVTTILASSITKANFFAEIKKEVGRTGTQPAEAKLVAAGDISAHRARLCMVACHSTNNPQLLNPLVLKLIDVEGLQPDAISACMRFAIFKLLDLLKQSGTDKLRGAVFDALLAELRRKSTLMYLSTLSAWPVEKDMDILVDFLVTEREPELSLQSVLAKLKSVPWQSDRCQKFVTLLQGRIAESPSANAKAALTAAITSLVQMVIVKVDLMAGNAHGNLYGRPPPAFPKVITALMQFCRSTGNMARSTDLLKRVLSTFSSTQQVQSHLIPLLSELRYWAISEKLPLTSDSIAFMFRSVMEIFVSKILGPKPAGAEAILALVHKLTCSCAPCVSAKHFLIKSADRSIRLDRLGAPKRKHVEQSLTAYCKSACTWSIIGSPQGLMIQKLPEIMKPAQWNADRMKAVALLKGVSTDLGELQDIFGREGLIKLAWTLGWPKGIAASTSTSLPSTMVPQPGPVVPRAAPTPQEAVPAPRKRKATEITTVIDLCSP